MDQQSADRGSVRHEEPTFGYAIRVPGVFVALMNTVDPLARQLRGVHDKQPDEESKLTGSWPVGFADPEVLGDIGGSHMEPLRLLEFDVLERPDPLSEDQLSALRQTVCDALPGELEWLDLPGFDFLGVQDVKLGPLDALRFDYEWNGPSDDRTLRDHGLVIWAPTPTAVYHMYHHCPADVWDAWWPEIELILASFELIERRPPEPRPREET